MGDPLEIGVPRQPRKKTKPSNPQLSLSPDSNPEGGGKILSRSRSFFNRFKRTKSQKEEPIDNSNSDLSKSPTNKRKKRLSTLKKFRKSGDGLLPPKSEPRSKNISPPQPLNSTQSLNTNFIQEKPIDHCESLPIDIFTKEIDKSSVLDEIEDNNGIISTSSPSESVKKPSKFSLPLDELSKQIPNPGQLSDRSAKLKQKSLKYLRKSFTHRDEQRDNIPNFPQTSRISNKLSPLEVTFQRGQLLYNEEKIQKSQKIFKEILKEFSSLSKRGKLTSKLYFLFACSRYYFAQCYWDSGNCKNSEKHARESLHILDSFLVSEKAFLPKNSNLNELIEINWTPGQIITLESVWYQRSIAEELVKSFFLLF